MITKPQLKEKHQSSIEKYFDSILESQVAGENPELLIKVLSQRQRNHLASWLDDPDGCKFHHSHIDEVKKILFTQNS